jgi:methyl-accepting chemotaxis protein
VNTAVAQMDSVTQTNAANSEEAASASEELSAQAEELDHIVARLVAMVQGGRAGAGGVAAGPHGDQAHGNQRRLPAPDRAE